MFSRVFDHRVVMLMLLLSLQTGCTTSGSSKNTPVAPLPEPAQQALSAADIRSTLAGSSWRFKGPRNTGTTLYAADGSSLVEVDGKGVTKGKWQTKDGQLCESFDPAPWLPSGVPMSCYPFTRGSGTNSYQAGKATFTKAS